MEAFEEGTFDGLEGDQGPDAASTEDGITDAELALLEQVCLVVGTWLKLQGADKAGSEQRVFPKEPSVPNDEKAHQPACRGTQHRDVRWTTQIGAHPLSGTANVGMLQEYKLDEAQKRYRQGHSTRTSSHLTPMPGRIARERALDAAHVNKAALRATRLTKLQSLMDSVACLPLPLPLSLPLSLMPAAR